MPSAIMILIPVLGGLIAGIMALSAVLWLAPRKREAWQGLDADVLSEPRQFQFRHGYLVNHSGNVGFLLPFPIDHLKAWDSLIEALSDINETVPTAFDALRDTGLPFKLEGPFGRDRVVMIGLRDGEDLRITIATAEERQGSVRIDLSSLKAMESEISMLARVGDTSPTLSWAVNDARQVVWSNAAYLERVAQCAGPDAAQGWPLHVLFPEPDDSGPGKTRRKYRDRAGIEHWFEVTTSAPDTDGLRHGHAIPLDTVIKAEDSRRTFIQTLTKSFAFLPSGLAIFDRNGQLTLFNPALMDMTGLDGAWLSRRPLLADFFDALRDRQKLPEPRDYKTWRDSLSDIERTAGRGIYIETWTLPSGATFRVTGRPQGDGAVTLMLEDISADVIADRTHRADQDMMMAVLEDLDDGIAIFEADGTRILANAAATALWGDGSAGLPATLDGCITYWKTLSHPHSIWGELRDLIRSPDADWADWDDTIGQTKGPALRLRVSARPGGRIALTFRPDVAVTPAQSEVPAKRIASA